MTITATTITAAIGQSDTTLVVSSTTGITAPNFQTATGITWLQIDQEVMTVVGVNTTTGVVNVLRGQNGSVAAAHVINSNVQIGLPGDFGLHTELMQSLSATTVKVGQRNYPAVFLAGTADAIPAGAAQFYVVKTAGVDAMTLAAPNAGQEGNIIDVWSDTANAHTITATSLFANGTALKTTATFAAQRGAGLTLRCCNLVYHVLAATGITFS